MIKNTFIAEVTFKGYNMVKNSFLVEVTLKKDLSRSLFSLKSCILDA